MRTVFLGDQTSLEQATEDECIKYGTRASLDIRRAVIAAPLDALLFTLVGGTGAHAKDVRDNYVTVIVQATSGERATAEDLVRVRSTVDLGRNLGLRVVAEGVETVEMFDELRNLGCDIAQGYLLSRPLPADELTVWAMDWRSTEEKKALVGSLS